MRRTHASRRHAARLLAVVGACLALGCAAFQHGYEVRAYEGQTLAVKTNEGARRLAAEARMDPTVDAWLDENGRPDYLHIVNRQQIYLFYVERDRAVMFRRDLALSEVQDLGRIPGSLLEQLPPAASRRIVAKREAAARVHARSSRVRRLSTRPAPARRSDAGAGRLMVGFDVDAVVARMKPPMTAADPGVQGWRTVTQRDGGRRSTAKAGSTTYEVAPRKVAVSFAMPSTRTSVSSSARLGIARVNHAIFGAKAEAVTQAVLKLAAPVARDRSGRTRVARRIHGRTVQIARLPGQSLLLYAVHL